MKSVAVLLKSRVFAFLFLFSKVIVFVICLCSFDPQDIILKNIDLLPDTNDKTNRVPNFIPKDLKDEKPQKLFDRPKMPDIKVEEKPADDVVKVKGFLKEYIFTTQDELEKAFTPTEEGINNMFHLKEIGLVGDKPSKSKPIKITTLDAETKKFPFINPSGMKVYNGKTWIVKGISDFQAVGIEDVLPKSVGAPLTKKDYDPQSIFEFFPKGITPDDMLKTKIIDIIP